MVAEISVSRILCDFTVLCITAIPLLIFHEFVTPYKRGFYCDDESIRYPFRKSTVSRQMLIVVGILIPTLLILMTEVLRTLRWEKRFADEFGTYRCRRYNVHRLIVRLYVFIGYFFLGVCFNQLMVDIGKYTIGRHRPHFLDVCKPDPGYFNCPNNHLYITNYTCTETSNKSRYLIHEAQLSFYSGHSAFSFYAAWYTTFYLQARLFRPLYSRLVLPVLQFALFGGAAYVAYTRVSDYKHHWSDVLVGAIMGSAIGIINALFIAEVFERREIPHEYRRKTRTLGSTSPQGQHAADEALNSKTVKYDKSGRLEIAEDGSDLGQPTRVVVHEERLPSIMHPARAEISPGRAVYTSPYSNAGSPQYQQYNNGSRAQTNAQR
ncbi:PAP2 superfamily domain-containing protein [Ditylenchus destructor]|uniref:PAP2 superfamily domain-containing protein n=1 Tax=Ditylenchus destructor TaxID=166010 RepID=A0AAD4MY51_9BILA|nr:PAP2 superfamily domain-containing protein [Ditylenchus destructor]